MFDIKIHVRPHRGAYPANMILDIYENSKVHLFDKEVFDLSIMAPIEEIEKVITNVGITNSKYLRNANRDSAIFIELYHHNSIHDAAKAVGLTAGRVREIAVMMFKRLQHYERAYRLFPGYFPDEDSARKFGRKFDRLRSIEYWKNYEAEHGYLSHLGRQILSQYSEEEESNNGIN